MWVDVLNTIAIILIMLGVGSAIDIEDLRILRKKPKPWLLGLGLQMILLPLLAFLFAFFAPISSEYKVGIFLLSLCPGGTTSNFICHLANGDVALSVALTTVNSFLILFTIPTLGSWAVEFFMSQSSNLELPFLSTLYQVFFLLLLPAAGGFFLRYYFVDWAIALQKYIKWINLALLFIVYTAKLLFKESAGGSGILWTEILELLPFLLALHLIAMFGSRYFSVLWGVNNSKSTTIGVEVGLQNTTLTIFICAVLLGNQNMSKPALVMAMFSFFTSFAFAIYYLRKNQRIENINR